jgi:signal transduction histidine kinase
MFGWTAPEVTGLEPPLIPEELKAEHGGQVTVRARARDGEVEVTVEDRGIGIADGDHQRIFERFFQGEAGDRRRFGGIGIGLYIVRRLAVAQDGQVNAASRDGGSVMRLVLRIAG